jgi:integrase
MASLYRRGKVWWSKSYEAGKMVRTSMGTTDKAEARRKMRELASHPATSVVPIPSPSVTWDTAAADLLGYYQAYRTLNQVEAEARLKLVTKYWRGWKPSDIDAAAILGYVARLRQQGLAAATINLNLATLRRALRLAHEYGKLDKVPSIKMLRPADPRSGFFERADFDAVAQALPDDLALVVRIGYTYGWRLRSEVLTLTKGQVDLPAGTLRLMPGSTKNRAGRVVYLTDDLKAGIAEQLARVRTLDERPG